MNKILPALLFLIISELSAAQQSYIDSLKNEVRIQRNDTMKMILYGYLNEAYAELNPDSTILYAEKELAAAKKFNFKLEEVRALSVLGYGQMNKGNYPRSLQSFLAAITIAEDRNSEKNVVPPHFPSADEFGDKKSEPFAQRLEVLSRVHQYAGILYGNANNYEKAIAHYLQARQIANQINNVRLLAIINLTLGRTYLVLKKTDSALIILQKSYDYATQSSYKRYLGSILLNLGRVHVAKGNDQQATEYFRQAIAASLKEYYYRGVIAGNLALADLFKRSGKEDSALLYIKQALPVAQFLNAPDLSLRTYTALADYYKTKKISDSAVKYQSFIIKINDSLFNSKHAQEFQNIDFDEQQKQQQIEAAESAYRNKFKIYSLLAGLAIFLLLAIILWRNSLQRKKANTILSHKKEELESALKTLRSTQAQLIQSEKMASLGELTAGISHEIQNPLNFVNNFSEVNGELISELVDEVNKGNLGDVKAIADNIRQNLEKINHHGKRADAIVKGMLQHSRTSTGIKEPTDINKLADEYLRLAYHGLRAKDKNFNVEIKTDFDKSIGEIDIVPQDIGRALLNLFNNAFYAVNEKSKLSGISYQVSGESAAAKNAESSPYVPIVTIVTKKTDDKIEIAIADNANGIPQNIIDKIFQPFFTTKPTGQGTGLGLSLAYEIVKAHGGEVKAETKEGKGAIFTIKLPFNPINQ